MSRFNRRKLAPPLTLFLIWGLVVQPVLPVQAQPANPSASSARPLWPSGVWLIAEGKQCTPLGDRVEMAGKIRISDTGSPLRPPDSFYTGLSLPSDAFSVPLEFCGSVFYVGKFQGRNLEVTHYNEPGQVLFQGIVSEDGNTIEGEEIDEQTGARSRFVWQREIPDRAEAPKTDDDVEPLKIEFLAKYRDFERGGAGDSGAETPISIVVDPAPVGKTVQESSAAGGPSFPGAEKPSNVKNSRTIFIYGRTLKKEPNRPVSIESLNDRSISYTVLDPEARGISDAAKAEMLSAIEVGQKKAQEHMSLEQKEAFKKMDQILVRADFRGTVLPDFKEFKLNGVPGRWFLNYGNTKAEIRFVRLTGGVSFVVSPDQRVPRRVDETERTDFIFLPERLTLEVETEQEFAPDIAELARRQPLTLARDTPGFAAPDRLRLTLLRNGELVKVGDLPLVLEATRVPGQKKLYRTAPFDILPEGAPGDSPVKARYGDRLVPQLAAEQDRWLIFTPAVARAFLPGPAGTRWEQALGKAARAFPVVNPNFPGKRVPYGTSFSLDHELRAIRAMRNPELRDIAKDVLHEEVDDNFNVAAEVRLGHLAAMYLLRDMFVEMMSNYQNGLSKIDFRDEQTARASRDLIAPIVYSDNPAAPNFPLTNIPVLKEQFTGSARLAGPLRIPLREALFDDWFFRPLDLIHFPRNLSNYLSAARGPGYPEDLEGTGRDLYTRDAVKEALETYKKAVSDALARANDIEERDFKKLLELTGVKFDAVVTKLLPRVMKFDRASGRWVPDVVARKWVGEIDAVAGRLKAQEKVDEAEFQVALLALGLVAFAATGSLAVSITVNAFTAADVPLYVIPNYLKGDEDVKFAFGASGVLGQERLKFAEAERTPEWALVLAVGGAALGVTVDLGQILAATVKTQRAAQALAKIKDKGLRAFKELAVEEQTAILRKGADGAAKAARGEAVDGTEQAAMALVAKHADEAIAASGAGARTAARTTLPRPPAAPAEEIRNAKAAIEAKLSEAESKLRAAEGGTNKLAVKEAKDIVGELKIRKKMLDEALEPNAKEIAQLSADDLEFLKTVNLTHEHRATAQKLLLEIHDGWSELKHAFNEGRVRKVDMFKVVKHRNEVVDKLLDDVLREVSPQGGLERKAFGSTDLTSDYDISIKGDGAELVVIKFNEKFRLDPRFKGLESGTVFDTNIYTDPVYNLFKGKTPAGFTLELDPLQLDDLRQVMYEKMATRKYATDAEWADHFDRMIGGAPSEDMREVIKYAMVEAERGHISAQRLIARKLEALGIRPPAVLDENSLLRAANDVYGDILLDVHKLREEFKRIGKLGTSPDPRVVELLGGTDYRNVLRELEQNLTRGADKAVINRLKAQLQEMISQQARNKQGVALYFASEAYQADGTIAHVVGELQEAGWGNKITKESLLSAPRESKLTPGQYLDSFFENRANMFKELAHARNPATGAFDIPIYAAAKAAKYNIRNLDAVHQAGISLGDLVDDHIIELTVNIAKNKDKLEVVTDLLRKKNITPEKFIEEVENALNNLSVAALSKSPLENKARHIVQYWRDMDPELVKYVERPRRPGGGRGRPGGKGPMPPRPPDPEPPTPSRPPSDPDSPTAPMSPPSPSPGGPGARDPLVFKTPQGQEVRLPVAEHLGSGSFSSTYVHGNQSNRVVRITDVASNPEAARLDEFGRKFLETEVDQEIVRIVRRYEKYEVGETSSSWLSQRTVEVSERAPPNAKDLLKQNPDGFMSPGQAEAVDRATREINRKGHAWLDNKPNNYSFEKLPGNDRWRVVIFDPGGIVPIKASPGRTAAENARVLQSRINAPDPETVRMFARFRNAEPVVQDGLASDMKTDILEKFGKLIDFQKVGLTSLSQVQFNPSGVVHYPNAQQLFRLSDTEAARQAEIWRGASRSGSGENLRPPPSSPGQ